MAFLNTFYMQNRRGIINVKLTEKDCAKKFEWPFKFFASPIIYSAVTIKVFLKAFRKKSSFLICTCKNSKHHEHKHGSLIFCNHLAHWFVNFINFLYTSLFVYFYVFVCKCFLRANMRRWLLSIIILACRSFPPWHR